MPVVVVVVLLVTPVTRCTRARALHRDHHAEAVAPLASAPAVHAYA